MNKLIVTAPAKLNLYLQVLAKKDGEKLHQIRAVNCQLALADEITLVNQSRKIEVSCRFGHVCQCTKSDYCRGVKNLIVKAAELLREKSGRQELGVSIHVEKHIPPAVGLGGGSADAACVLKGLARLWKIGGIKEIKEIGEKIGSDVSYCLEGGLCEVSGFGEKIKRLAYKLPKRSVVIVVPEAEKPSTAWVYGKFDKRKMEIEKNDRFFLWHNLRNDFELLMVRKYPILGEIKQKLLKYGASGVILAGSGLAMVGFFKNKGLVQKAYQKLKKEYKKVYLTHIL